MRILDRIRRGLLSSVSFGGPSTPAPVLTEAPMLSIEGAVQTLFPGDGDGIDHFIVEYLLDGNVPADGVYTVQYGDASPTRPYVEANEAGKLRWIRVTPYAPSGVAGVPRLSAALIGEPDYTIKLGEDKVNLPIIDASNAFPFKCIDRTGAAFTDAAAQRHRWQSGAIELTGYNQGGRWNTCKFDRIVNEVEFVPPIAEMVAKGDIPTGATYCTIGVCPSPYDPGSNPEWINVVAVDIANRGSTFRVNMTVWLNGAAIANGWKYIEFPKADIVGNPTIKIERRVEGGALQYRAIVNGDPAKATAWSVAITEPAHTDHQDTILYANTSNYAPAETGGWPLRTLDSIKVKTLPAAYVSVTAGTVIVDPSNTDACLIPISGVTTETELAYAIVNRDTDELIADWSAPIAITGGAIDVDVSTAARNGENLAIYFRSTATHSVIGSTTATALVLSSPADHGPAALSINLENTTQFVDLAMHGSLRVRLTTGGGDKIVASPCVEVDPATAVLYCDASLLNCDAKGRPSGAYPANVSDVRVLMVDHYAPSLIGGIYDVEFTPGWDWAINQNPANWTLSNYNKDAGTAVITISDTASVDYAYFVLRGFGVGAAYTARTFPPPAEQYFRMRPRGAPAGKLLSDTYKASVAGLCGPGGYLRFMSNNEVNRVSIAGVKWTPSNDALPAVEGEQYRLLADYIREEAGEGPFAPGGFQSAWPLRAMLEAAEDTGCNLYLNWPDTMTDEAHLKVATWFKANKQPGTKLLIGHSNENGWNFGPPFRQSTLTYNRAQASGIGAHVQNALDSFRVHQIWDGVFAGDASVEYVLEWQFASSPLNVIKDMIAADPLATHFHVGPYGASSFGFDSSSYTSAAGLAFMSQADRDLAETDPTLFLSKWDASLRNALANGTVPAIIDFYNRVTAASLAVHGDKRVKGGSYEHAAQHSIPSGYPTSQLRDATCAALATYMRSSTFGELDVWYAAQVAGRGGIQTKYTSFQPMSANGIRDHGVWGVQDRLGDEAQSPAAEYRSWVATWEGAA